MTELAIRTEGDTQVIATRRFAAPSESVYRAHTEAELIQKWILGSAGWTMPVCINAPRPGSVIHARDRTLTFDLGNKAFWPPVAHARYWQEIVRT